VSGTSCRIFRLSAVEGAARLPFGLKVLLGPAELVIDHSVITDFFGRPDALARNIDLEYRRNAERYAFLRWGQQALPGLRVVPPGTGICHQVNLEHLARVVFAEDGTAFPDTLVGTDSHTPMVNGLGVLGWGSAASRPRRRCSAGRCPC